MINLDAFKSELKEATKTAFVRVARTPGLYAFALMSDENCQTILPVANTEGYLQQARADYDDPQCQVCQFSPDEWDFGLLPHAQEWDKLQQLLADQDLQGYPNDDAFEGFRQQLFGLLVEVLLELKTEGVFAAHCPNDILLLVHVSEFEFDPDFTRTMISQLNSPHYAQAYLQWMSTWGQK